MKDKFVQVNLSSRVARFRPVGYYIRPSGCWEWGGYIRKDGYASTAWSGRTVMAHRLVFELQCGAVPKDMQLDHLCRNRRCVNPKHLEIVSSTENWRRGFSPPTVALRNGACLRGHTFNKHNTYITKAGKKHCRACDRVRYAERRKETV